MSTLPILAATPKRLKQRRLCSRRAGALGPAQQHTRAADLQRGDVAKLHTRVGKQFPTMANRAVLDTLRAAFNLSDA